MGIRDWLPAILRSPDPRVEDANSAAGAPVASNGKLPLVAQDGALAAEEANPFGNEKPPKDAAPQNLNTENILTANANPPGNSTSSGESSGWFQINRYDYLLFLPSYINHLYLRIKSPLPLLSIDLCHSFSCQRN